VGLQDLFDLAKLDAVAGDLHLGVLAAQELDVAAGKHPGLVARAVEPSPGHAAALDEPFRGQVRALVIAEREPVAGDAKLSDLALRHGIERLVEDRDRRVLDRLADRHRGHGLRQVARNPVAAGEGGRLGGAVAVDEVGAKVGARLAHMLDGQRFTADQQLLDPRQHADIGVDDRVED